MSRKLQIVSKIKNLSEGDKTWLIGFIEAAGRFTITQRGELAIGIIQGYENYAVLNKIREMVGFGAIVRQGARTFRYVVQDTEGMGELINMINGRLVLEKSISGPVGLGRLIEAYNKQNTNPIKQISRKVQPTWEDGWLSGYTDGSGSFNIVYVKTKDKFMIRYIISQKGSLAEIREVIGGTIERAYPRESIVIKDESGSQGQNTGKIVEYMEKNPLKTTKWNSFLIWRYIRARLLSEKLTPQSKENLKGMMKLINQDPMAQGEIYIPYEDGEMK